MSKPAVRHKLKKGSGYFMVAAIIWTALMAASMLWTYVSEKQQTINLVSVEARTLYNKDKAFRLWAASHGGVYVPETESTPANPRLSHIPDRDITTKSGKKLTLMNPAYMIRTMVKEFEDLYGVKGKITSFPDKLFYQGNMPDAWELSALYAFLHGAEEVKEVSAIDGSPHLRLMRPIFIEQSCLKCHGFQGYQVGDLRGGIGVAVPLLPYLNEERKELFAHGITHVIIWFLGLLVFRFFFSRNEVLTHQQFKSSRKLIENEERTRLLLNSMAEGIYGTDTNGKCTLVNNAFLKMLGYSDESELLGNNIHEMIHHSYPDGSVYPAKDCKVFRTYREGVRAHIDDEVLWRKDGSSFPAAYWAHPVYDEKKVVGSVVTFLDISDSIKSRDALKKSQSQLQSALEGTIISVSKAVGMRDQYTAGHQQRVAELSKAIATEMGLGADQVEGIYLAATIHDIGKIKLPAEVLTKPGKLSEFEYILIKEHPESGYQILKDVEFPWLVAEVAHQHHERIDGTGYPQGLKGEEICIEARIVAVADVVEAMNSHRPYRPGLGLEAALNEIRTHKGSLYDETAVDACLKLFEENRFSFQYTNTDI